MDSVNPQAPGGSSFGNFALKFYKFRGMIRRNWWILAITVGLGLAYKGWVVFKQPELYESVSQLNIREEIDANGDATKFNVDKDAFTATQLALLKSDGILSRAAEAVKLSNPELASEIPEITTSIIPRSYIFIVTGRGKNPEYTRLFVDAVVASFIDFRDQQRQGTVGTVMEGFEKESKSLQEELNSATQKLQEYEKKNDMLYGNEQKKHDVDYLTSLKTQRAAMQTELHRLQMLTPEQVMQTPSLSVPTSVATPGGDSNGAQDASSMNSNLMNAYFQATQELARANAQLQERSKVWKPKHPRLQALKDHVDEIKATVDSVREQSRQAVAQQVDALNAQIKVLDGSIAEWEKRVTVATSQDAEYKRMQADVKRVQDKLDNLKDPSILKVGSKNDMFRVLQPASPSVLVPRATVKQLTMGFVGGFVVGLALLLFRDRADDRLNSSSEMLDKFNEPILGQIPDVMESRGESGLPLLQLEDERYTFAEAFRSLRSSLIFMPNQPDLRTLLVTSAIPNEGKSTIASNLAITMAAAGANVVLVDADLRRGDLASLFDTDGRTGLSNILRGEVTWESAAQTTKYPCLTLIPRGPVTGQSSELLLLPSTDKLLEDLKNNFDLVVFNTAPILATDDTPTLSPHFDGTLMVIRAQFTSARLTHNALNALYQRQVNVLGLILNCVDTEMPDYYYYRYPKYYAAK